MGVSLDSWGRCSRKVVDGKLPRLPAKVLKERGGWMWQKGVALKKPQQATVPRARKAVCCWLLFCGSLRKFLSAGKQRQTNPSIVNRGESSADSKSRCVCHQLPPAPTSCGSRQAGTTGARTQEDANVFQLVRAVQGIMLEGERRPNAHLCPKKAKDMFHRRLESRRAGRPGGAIQGHIVSRSPAQLCMSDPHRYKGLLFPKIAATLILCPPLGHCPI